MKIELLDQLRIDRKEKPPKPRVRPILLGLSTLVLLALGFTVFVTKSDALAATSVSHPIKKTAKTKQPATQVRIDSVTKPITKDPLNATGYVTARRIATVSAKVTGKVERLFVEEGDIVAKGDLMAILESEAVVAQLRLAESEVAVASGRLLELDTRLRQANLKLDRAHALQAQHLISTVELDDAQIEVELIKARILNRKLEVRVAQQRLSLQQYFASEMEIRAPFSGVVVAKTAQPGEMISPISAGGGFTRTGIGTLVDMDSLEVEVDVSESNINQIKTGQAVDVILNAYPDTRIPAQVITIVPTANRSKATVKVRIGFLSKNSRALPEMGVRVTFYSQPSISI